MERGTETGAAWRSPALEYSRIIFDRDARVAFEQLRNHSSHLVFLLERNS
jgi:hypothetical protein